jgi:hypothetical protein
MPSEPKNIPSNPAASLDFCPGITAFWAAKLEPHFKQMTACGFVADPQTGQNKRPASGLAPQFIQISGFPTRGFPQFRQNGPDGLFSAVACRLLPHFAQNLVFASSIC